MKYAHRDVCCPSVEDGRKARAEHETGLEQPGTRWRSALAALAGPPLRLHRYRNFHAAVVEDAIRAYDCRMYCGDDQ